MARRIVKYRTQGFDSKGRLLSDSGIIDVYRPAQHTKPEGVINRVVNRVKQWFTFPKPEDTTEQGAAGAASPITYEAALWQQIYEYRALVQDCNQLYLDDPRVSRAIDVISQAVGRKGVNILATEAEVPSKLYTKAQDIFNHLVERITPDILVSWCIYLLVEGNLFVQAVVDEENEIVEAVQMPAASMQRMTDDTDSFIDPERAFCQVDVLSNENIATFPLALMHHERWKFRQGNRYGFPDIMPVRRHIRRLDLMEEAKAVDRMGRAQMQLLFKIGNEKNPGNWNQVDEFKQKNGMVEGEGNVWNPYQMSRNYFGNGLTEIERIEGSQMVDHIDDLRYFEDILLNAGLPTPSCVYGHNLPNLNRDVFDDIRDEYNKRIEILADSIGNVIRWLAELALMLQDIYPDTVPFSIHLSTSTVERPEELVERIVLAKNERLISHKKAIQLLSEMHDIKDVDAEHAQIQKEQEQDFNRELETAKAAGAWKRGLTPKGEDPDSPDGSAKPTNGKASNGRAKQSAVSKN